MDYVIRNEGGSLALVDDSSSNDFLLKAVLRQQANICENDKATSYDHPGELAIAGWCVPEGVEATIKLLRQVVIPAWPDFFLDIYGIGVPFGRTRRIINLCNVWHRGTDYTQPARIVAILPWQK